MTINEVLNRLLDEKYTLLVIAKQSSVPYMRVYRAFKGEARLSEQEESRIKAFAFVQPPFTRGVQ